jgi:hypothetical protein
MQLGTRWSVGQKPPAAVPVELHAQIQAVEDTITQGQYAGVGLPSWTLTWLERRPVAELDTGVIVYLGADGTARVRKDDDDEFAPGDH